MEKKLFMLLAQLLGEFKDFKITLKIIKIFLGACPIQREKGDGRRNKNIRPEMQAVSNIMQQCIRFCIKTMGYDSC